MIEASEAIPLLLISPAIIIIIEVLVAGSSFPL